MMKNLKVLASSSLLTLALYCASAQAKDLPRIQDSTANKKIEQTAETLDIEPVWSGHRVGFSLLTSDEKQYVGYYDAKRQMTIASRKLDSSAWEFKKLPTHVGWDSHNSITMAMDAKDNLHVSGNMHCVPLIYFTATKPNDAQSLTKIFPLVDAAKEQRATYPHFMKGPNGELIFRYRDGGSGQGNDYYNVYDAETKKWKALLPHPILDGLGLVNGYFSIPAKGPDGYFHTVGVWRDTPDAATNHDLSYARSRDMIHWETGAGKPLKTPLSMKNIDIPDPVPAKGGMINGNVRLGFDTKNRPVIAYHKYDTKGDTQIYNARLEEGHWKIYQTSDWDDYRWDFGGGGTLNFEVSLGAVQPFAKGQLTQSFRNANGSGQWILDEETLKPVALLVGSQPSIPRTISRLESNFPGMGKRISNDIGNYPAEKGRYVLSWETLPANRDYPREGDLPAPSMLRVHKLVRKP